MCLSGCCFIFYNKKVISTEILGTHVPFLFVDSEGSVSSFVVDSDMEEFFSCLGADLIMQVTPDCS